VTEEYDYIAYIDESGDTGLNGVRPMKPTGSSEWFVMGAALFSAKNEALIPGWTKDMLDGIKSRQRAALHFTDIKDENKKASVCQSIAKLPARYFAVCSNKKNMQNYKNPFAARKSEQLIGTPAGWNYNWFYYWISRVLLEKVTDYVMRRSMRKHGAARQLRVIFSANDGLKYDELSFYYDLLKMHDAMDTQFLRYDRVTWDVLAKDNLFAFPHETRAGLQVADAIASSFFLACDKYHTGGPNPRFARLLRPRMTMRATGVYAGYGVKLMPTIEKAKLLPDQAAIFHEYGYPR
jgi:hypothetical protein